MCSSSQWQLLWISSSRPFNDPQRIMWQNQTGSGKNFILTAPMDYMCQFENGWFSPQATQNFLASCVCGTAGHEQSTG